MQKMTIKIRLNHLLILAFFISGLMLISKSADAQLTKSERKIMQVMQEQESAWNKGDLTGFMQGYWRNDSLHFITVKGISRGWDKMLNRYQLKYPNKESMGILKMDIIKMDKITSSCYLITGHWQLKLEKDSPAGFFTLLFKRIHGKWLIVKDHTS